MPQTASSRGLFDPFDPLQSLPESASYLRELKSRFGNFGLAAAAYNAGPGRIRQLRTEAKAKGLDPNVWFGNVERVASERIGRETVTYVSNIFKYYLTYRLLTEQQERRAAAKASLQKSN